MPKNNRHFVAVLPLLPMDDAVWSSAYDPARRAGARGFTVPSTDVAIAACARRHGAEIEAADRAVGSPAS